MGFGIAFSLFAPGCRCPPAGSTPRGHFTAVGDLRDAVYRDDAEALVVAARVMDGGDAAARGDAAAEERLHGALGFLLVAEDAAERGEGLAAVARACGDCHAEAGVRLPVREPAVGACPQAAAADAAWWGLVAGSGGDEAALAAGAAGCEGCHQKWPVPGGSAP